MKTLFDDSGAVFSLDRQYRFRLWRSWAGGDGWLNFLMLNPSTADEAINDPTVERCERRAREMGFAGLIVTNLFAYRSTSPLALQSVADPVGDGNDRAIRTAAEQSKMVVCAWGEHGAIGDRARRVVELLDGVPLHALRVNRGGMPAHPLYQSYDVRPTPWTPTF